MAKNLFEGLNVNYTAVELDMNANGRQFQDVLEQMTGGRTVSIFILLHITSNSLGYTHPSWVRSIASP